MLADVLEKGTDGPTTLTGEYHHVMVAVLLYPMHVVVHAALPAFPDDVPHSLPHACGLLFLKQLASVCKGVSGMSRNRCCRVQACRTSAAGFMGLQLRDARRIAANSGT